MRSRRHRTAATLLLTVAVGFGVAGCSSDDDGGGNASDSSGSAGKTGTEIVIRDFAYEPDTLRGQVGDTITIRNTDDTDHTVTADDGPIDTGDIAGDGTATIELTEAGAIPYYCDIHNYMTGTIRVTE